MTDEAESRVDGGAPGASAPDEADAARSSDASRAASDSRSSSPAGDSVPDGDPPVDFGDLSLPQRVFVAAVQNPARGVVIVGLFAFAFSFYVAFWMVFPRVAAFMSGVGLVIAAGIAAVYFASGRLSG